MVVFCHGYRSLHNLHATNNKGKSRYYYDAFISLLFLWTYGGGFFSRDDVSGKSQTYYAPEFTNIYITRFVKNKTSRTSRTNTAADNKSTIFPIFHFLNSPASDDKFSYPLFNRLPDVYVTGYSISHMKANLTFLARKITPRLPSSEASATIWST